MKRGLVQAGLVALGLIVACSSCRNQPQSECVLALELYPVTGGSIDEIRQSIATEGPVDPLGIRRDAAVNWTVTWNWPFDKAGQPLFEGTELSCLATMTLPNLRPTELSDSDRAEWERYFNAIRLHELEHFRLINQHHDAVREAIVSAARLNPKITAAESNAIAQRALSKLRALDRELDQRTDHGRREGAVLRAQLAQ